LNNFAKHGGGKIKRKILFSVLLLFGLALILNANTSVATNVSDNVVPKVTSFDPVNKALVSNNKIIKVKFNEPVKIGTNWIELYDNGKFKSTKKTIKGNILSITPKSALTKGAKYTVVLHTGSVKDLSGNGISLHSSSFTVVPLTLAQMKDGLSRTQKFYNKNYRLPKYVSYGSKQIPIIEFKKIIATVGLKIKTTTTNGVSASRPVYITSDNIINRSKDNGRIANIIKGLRALGIKAYNMGVGPGCHISVLQSNKVPNNALIVDIYGGACAGTLYEMGSKWYKSIRGTNKVFTVFWPPSKVITGLSFLVRAHDDNFSPSTFKGLAHPDQYLLRNGYNYLYSGNIQQVVQGIFYQATH
jgi:hypothetical protein